MLSRYAKRQLAVNSTTWTALVNDAPYDFCSFKCATSDLSISTNTNDATAVDTLPAGVQEVISSGAGAGAQISEGSAGVQRVFGARFPGGTVCWLKSVAASATVTVTWIL